MIFKVTDASFGYTKENVFQNVSFEIKSGEILAVLGPNGAGKTTLLKSIMNMLTLKTGKAEMDGKDIRKMSEREFFQTVSYVPQAKNVVNSFKVIDAVLLGLSPKMSVFQSPKEDDEKKACEILHMLGIEHLKNKSCNAISGGELQMVLIARALVREPKMLILDEPESNLDFRNQLIILDTITRLREQGIACIFNTHYPSHALQRADKALILSEGNAIFGETQDVITGKNIEKAFRVEARIEETVVDGRIVKNVYPIKTIN